MISICLLGASGSIGHQTLDVINKNPDAFILRAISIGHKTHKLKAILNKFPSIKFVCLKSEKAAKLNQNIYKSINFYHGDEGLISLIRDANCEMVVNALVGFVGLLPTITALKENKKVALANKESLVVGGELINNLIKDGKGEIIPIDSEHVAIDKCLNVENKNVSKLILTASGGAFKDYKRKDLINVKSEEALKHPTWKMGKKITIDSATMVNKTFEIIEAHYLFNYPYEKINVLLHPDSIIHSLVKYSDGSYRFQVGKPDMREMIKYALFQRHIVYETRKVDSLKTLSFKYNLKTFNISRYPIKKWAKVVIDQKGTYGTVFNAVNEVAVNAYLHDEIPFLMIEEIINHFMEEYQNIVHPTYEIMKEVDISVRKKVRSYIESRR